MAGAAGGTGRPASYVLGHSDWEMERLVVQARLVDPITRRFFTAAGIVPGMHVLDAGSGVGDVSFLLAGMVGERGSVTGVERVAAALDTARARARTIGVSNATFVEGELSGVRLGRTFDALAGRYILMFQPDPAAVLRNLASHVKPGGIVVFHEPDWDGARSTPPVATYDLCCRWIVDTLIGTNTEHLMGAKLPATFASAGLPTPRMHLESFVGAGANAPDEIRLITDIVRTVLPEMERLGIVKPGQVDPGTLADRVRDELVAARGVVVGRSEVGAWTRTPTP